MNQACFEHHQCMFVAVLFVSKAQMKCPACKVPEHVHYSHPWCNGYYHVSWRKRYKEEGNATWPGRISE